MKFFKICFGKILGATLAVSMFLVAHTPAFAGTEQVVPVMVYHEIIQDEGTPGEFLIRLDDFEEQMKYLAKERYHTLDLDELLGFLEGKDTPEKSVVLTFDDGWRSALWAVPILERYQFKASFWIITGAMNGRFGEDYLNANEVLQLDRHPLFQVESHTVTHPWNKKDNLYTWTKDDSGSQGVGSAVKELRNSKHVLEKLLGRPVNYLAWPCGWYNRKLIDIARQEGYSAMMTTLPYAVRRKDSPLEIPRYFVNGSKGLEYFIQQLQGKDPGNKRIQQSFIEHRPIVE